MTRKMKDSNAAWMKEVPENWGINKIGQLYFERREKVSDRDYPPLSVTMQGIVPQLSNVAKSDAHDDRKLVCEGDFAINSRSDRRGSCGIASQNGSVSLINTVLTPRKRMDTRYYSWLFHTSMFADEYYKWGHGIVDDLWTTKWSDMKGISIPEPPIEEQIKIADFLDEKCGKIDEALEKTKASAAYYKKMKQMIITRAVTRGVRGERLLKESGVDFLGKIPADWGIIKTNKLCSVITDYVASGSFASLAENVQYLDEPDYAMLVRTIDVSDKGRKSKHVYINEKAYRFLSNSNLLGGEIMLPNIGASVGDVYMVPVLYERMSLAPNAIMIKTNENDRYYYYYFLSTCGRQSLLDIAESTAQPKFNKTDFRQIKVVLPPGMEQQEIVDYLDEKCDGLDKIIAKKEELILEIEKCRQSIIYDYVTGKREVV